MRCVLLLPFALTTSICLASVSGPGGEAATHELRVAAAGCGELTLTAIAGDAIRVRCSKAPSALPELIYQNTLPVTASTGADAHVSWIKTAKMRATVDKQSGVIRFYNAQGHLLTEEMPGSRRWMASTASSDGTGTAEVRFALQPGEHLFGSGQFQDGFLNIARLPRKLVQLNTQISVPFFLSSNGYGMLWHQYGLTMLNHPAKTLALRESGTGASESVDVTTSAGTQRQRRQAKHFAGTIDVPATGDYALELDSGRTMTDRWNLSIDDTPVIDFANFWLPGSTSTLYHLSAGVHRIAVLANADDHPSLAWGMAPQETDLQSLNAPNVDYTIFAGSADEAIRSFRSLSGNAPMLPRWAFGFIQCRERYHSSEEILDTLQQFRKDDLPLDVIVQDWQYWGKYGWNAMRFDEDHYPDPARLVEQVHADHAHLMVSVWSRFDPKSEVGQQFAARNLFIPGTTWVDFFNPVSAQLYWQNFSTRMRSLGIDAWWLDATEPENDDLHDRKVSVGAGDDYRLVYPLFVNKTVYEGSRKDAPDRRVMILTRSAFSGEQRYGISTWSGDIGNGWDTLKRQVTAGLDYMAAAMPYWTTDTGGFFRPGKEQYTDPAYHERFLRWMEYSVFTPLLRVHGYQTNTEPWNYGTEMVEQQRQLLDLRYQLLPYIYAQAASVTAQGGTIMRPLVMDFPHDATALDQKYEFMFGPSFLVAPVLDPGVTVAQVYAPPTPGGWFDWWTGKHISNGGQVSVDAPLMQIPLLVRAGSVIAVGPTQQYTNQIPDAPLDVRVYPGANGHAELYDDDGTSYGYEKGRRSLVPITWNDTRRELTLGDRQGSFPEMVQQRKIHVRVFGGNAVTSKEVTYNGQRLSLRFPK